MKSLKFFKHHLISPAAGYNVFA